MKKRTCPECGHRFAMLTEPKLKSISNIHAYVCGACGAQLRIVSGIVEKLRIFGLVAIAGALVICVKWLSATLLPPSFAEGAWVAVSLLIIGGFILLVGATFEYEAQPGAPADGVRPHTMFARRVQVGRAANGFCVLSTFSHFTRFRLGLLLMFRYGFWRKGRRVLAVTDDAVYPDFVRGQKIIHASWDNWTGFDFLAGNAETDAFLHAFYLRHCAP